MLCRGALFIGVHCIAECDSVRRGGLCVEKEYACLWQVTSLSLSITTHLSQGLPQKPHPHHLNCKERVLLPKHQFIGRRVNLNVYIIYMNIYAYY